MRYSFTVTTMTATFQDFRYALRGLAKRPGFAIAATLTLALGIGASTAVFNLVSASLYPRLPVSDPDRLFAVFQYNDEGGYFSSLSYPAYLDYAEAIGAFQGFAVHSGVPLNLSEAGESRRVQGELVSADYFSVLGVTPTEGRGFVAGEDQDPGAHPVAVVSYGAWRRLFGSDPDLVGRTTRLNGLEFTIVGIAPEGFHGLELGSGTDIWIPLSMQVEAKPSWNEILFYGRGTHWLSAVGRLKGEATFAQAAQQVSGLATTLAEEYPDTQAGWSARLLPINEATMWPGYRSELAALAVLLAAVVGLTTFLACANVANMFLGRIVARKEELAVRLALGAGKLRLASQMLAETLVIAVPAGAGGLLAALWLSQMLARYRLSRYLPADLELGADLRTITFLIALTLVVSFLVGLIPAIQASREDLSQALRAGGVARAGTLGKARFRSSLSVVQIAGSLVVLACAVLLVRSSLRQLDIELGFDPHNVGLFSVDLALSGYEAQNGSAFYLDLEERLNAVPGVTSVGIASMVPLGQRRYMRQAYASGSAELDPRSITGNVVTPGFFETVSIPIVRGREFDSRDAEGAPSTIIVSEALARTFWPGQDPLGQRIVFRGREGETSFDVVGVAQNAQHGRNLLSDPAPFFYLPLYQNYLSRAVLHVKTEGEPTALVSEIRAAVTGLDPDLPVYDARTLEQHVRTVTAPAYVAAIGVGIMGIVGLLLAAVGIYAVVSFAVAQRTREIGIRLALGAEPRTVMRHVLGQGLTLLAAGIGIGAAAALVATRLFGVGLFGVDPSDPLAIAVAALVTAAATLIAVYLPARRVTKVDPVLALRSE